MLSGVYTRKNVYLTTRMRDILVYGEFKARDEHVSRRSRLASGFLLPSLVWSFTSIVHRIDRTNGREMRLMAGFMALVSHFARYRNHQQAAKTG